MTEKISLYHKRYRNKKLGEISLENKEAARLFLKMFSENEHFKMIYEIN